MKWDKSFVWNERKAAVIENPRNARLTVHEFPIMHSCQQKIYTPSALLWWAFDATKNFPSFLSVLLFHDLQLGIIPPVQSLIESVLFQFHIIYCTALLYEPPAVHNLWSKKGTQKIPVLLWFTSQHTRRMNVSLHTSGYIMRQTEYVHSHATRAETMIVTHGR